MDKFKKSLKKRILLMICLNGMFLVFILMTLTFGDLTVGSNVNIKGYINGFQVGVFIGVQVIMLSNLVKYLRALKNEKNLKKLYIEENDERSKLIRDKIGGAGFSLSVGMIAAGTVMTGFFNETVFFTLFAVAIFMVSIKAFLKLYYRAKY